jgi:glycolate oxidase FAD binding subunit
MSIGEKCRFLIWKGFNLTGISSYDAAGELREKVLDAIAQKSPLNITGGNSKAFYGRQAIGQPLDVSKHCGILNYEPTELVLTARCGTRLKDIESALADNSQMLGFEPPHFGPDTTLGGAIASGLSGPRRPYAGSLRDAVLGVKLLNGRGEIVKFGGEVMKNVAGFDVSRLQAGALGTLGILLEVSIKVFPKPTQEQTLVYAFKDNSLAIGQMLNLARKHWPVTAMSYADGQLRVRLSGAVAAMERVRQNLGGELMTADEDWQFWSALRDLKLAFFQDDRPLWRFSLPCAAELPKLSGDWFIDWGGALRWLKSYEPYEAVFSQAKAAGGHACLFRSKAGGAFQPLSPGVEHLHRNLKAAFDPYGIFNPGRLYPGC